MSVIEIKGLKVEACHGVHEEEKRSPQPFVFDIKLFLDCVKASNSDDIFSTVNYSEVSHLVYDYCKGNTFNLIEKLSYGAAMLIAEKYPALNAVEVTVHKPHAPIGLPFDDVCITQKISRRTVLLSLGSSEGDRRANLEGGIAALKNIRGVKLLNTSSFSETEPYGGVAKNKFLNCAVSLECLLDAKTLLDEIHEIEAEFKRVRDTRWADRTLDIDIVFFGSEVIEEEGLCVPHPDYMNRRFFIQPLKEIAPDFVCPVCHKRISDL